MSSDDDIFLKTFNEMISILKEVNSNINSIKSSMEVILPSIDGLGAGLTNINTQLSDLTKKIETLSKDIVKISLVPETKVISEKKPEKQISSKQKIESVPPKEPTTETPVQGSYTGTPQHPIFIDLVKKINESSTFKETGEILVNALEQIESSFSFSRVFYEIRRYGNSLIRKGTNDITSNERLELAEKILDWENRLAE
ncbi:MAG TPA: hypothetical protein VMX55_15225 [candidate division Zixibacteria bacterium]|nr:hypothetical protein [candidate division Zixibacteria bacterium]